MLPPPMKAIKGLWVLCMGFFQKRELLTFYKQVFEPDFLDIFLAA